jgi:hypothetical protein
MPAGRETVNIALAESNKASLPIFFVLIRRQAILLTGYG